MARAGLCRKDHARPLAGLSAHRIETTACPLASHSLHRRGLSRSMIRSWGCSRSPSRRVAAAIGKLWPHRHSTITKSPGPTSATRASNSAFMRETCSLSVPTLEGMWPARTSSSAVPAYAHGAARKSAPAMSSWPARSALLSTHGRLAENVTPYLPRPNGWAMIYHNPILYIDIFHH